MSIEFVLAADGELTVSAWEEGGERQTLSLPAAEDIELAALGTRTTARALSVLFPGGGDELEEDDWLAVVPAQMPVLARRTEPRLVTRNVALLGGLVLSVTRKASVSM